MRGVVNRQDRALSYAEALEIMKSVDYGVLATVDGEGKPCTAAVNYVMVDDTAFVFHSGLNGEKVRNIRLNPNVSFFVVENAKVFADHFTTVYTSAVAHGTAGIVENEEEKQRYLRALVGRYTENGISAQTLDGYIRERLSTVAVLKVTIEHLTAKARPALS